MTKLWNFLVVVATSACQNTGSVMVETDFDPEVDFAACTSYA
jgi:hypothetical protein